MPGRTPAEAVNNYMESIQPQHLHIGHGAMLGRDELQTAHLPTGYVSLPDIIRLLIRDFHATPRRHDWQSVLNALQS